MLIVLSPAKAMNFVAPDKPLPMTTPEMGEDIALLSETTRKLTVAQVKRLMSLSDNLARLNRDRFQAFDSAMEEGLQAAFAFNGHLNPHGPHPGFHAIPHLVNGGATASAHSLLRNQYFTASRQLNAPSHPITFGRSH